MKTSILNSHRILGLRMDLLFRALITLALIVTVVSCSDDSSEDVLDGETGAIEVTGIIINPKSPQPGDTIKVTVIIQGAENLGYFPTVNWSSSDNIGTFLENNELSVRWVAPTTSSIVRIAVSATGPTNSDNASVDVFVGSPQPVITSGAGELHLEGTGTTFYHLAASVSQDAPSFRGFTVNYFDGTSSTQVTSANPGEQYVFTSDLSMAAHSRLGPKSDPQNINDPMNVVLDDLDGNSNELITDDTRLDFPAEARHDMYTAPAFSPSGDLLAFSAFRPDAVQGAVDSFEVQVYDIGSGVTTNVSRPQGESRQDFYPTFSTDGNWLVFISDATGGDVWELFAHPVSGTVVDTNPASRIRVTDTGGLITNGTAGPTLPNPLKTWNPVEPVLALQAANGSLMLIEIIGGIGTVTQTFGIAFNIRELRWSNNGQLLAVSDGFNLYTVGLGGGQVTTRHTVPSSDQIRDIAWSPGDEFIVYRITRGQDAWFELIDIDAGTELTAPLVITSTVPKGDIEAYRRIMSTAPAMSADGIVYMLEFDKNTPRVAKLDISSALP